MYLWLLSHADAQQKETCTIIFLGICGLRTIVQCAYKMNPSGKRKYTQAELLALLR